MEIRTEKEGTAIPDPTPDGARQAGSRRRPFAGARRLPLGFILALLAVLLVLSMAVAVAVGSAQLSTADVFRMLLNRAGLTRFPTTWEPHEEQILFALRFPRVVAAAIVGGCLASAGVLLQGLLRNPMADPYVVGASGGAALGAVLGSLLGSRVAFLGFGAVPVLAFVGAVGAVALVANLASVGGRLPIVTVLLAGFAVSTLLGYTVSLLLVIDARLQLQLPRIYGWLLGGISVANWTEVSLIGALALATFCGALALGRSLNAFSLGEEGAARLGVAVERDKRWILAVSALLTACAVSISGLIGFVGLVVPHVTRLACGPDHRRLLPAATLAGAVFLVLADLGARTMVSPVELPVGILTAFLGGPVFLVLLRRARRDYQW